MIPKLDFTDAKLFYDLWIPLLDHVNRTYNVNPKLGKMTRADGLNRGTGGSRFPVEPSRGH